MRIKKFNEGVSSYLQPKSDDDIKKALSKLNPINRRNKIKLEKLPEELLPEEKEYDEVYKFGLTYNDIVEICALANSHYDWTKYDKAQLSIDFKEVEKTTFNEPFEVIQLWIRVPEKDYDENPYGIGYTLKIYSNGLIMQETWGGGSRMKYENPLKIYKIMLQKFKEGK